MDKQEQLEYRKYLLSFEDYWSKWVKDFKKSLEEIGFKRI